MPKATSKVKSAQGPHKTAVLKRRFSAELVADRITGAAVVAVVGFESRSPYITSDA
ncbi:MAG TPA: hypothetical protein VKN18_27355 [Blastocatellia bacterium]|nr:hypothetical protein [Blastocatellia bacterium]